MYILHKTEMKWIEYVVDAVHGKKSMSIVVPEIQEEQCDFQPGSATLYTLEDITIVLSAVHINTFKDMYILQ